MAGEEIVRDPAQALTELGALGRQATAVWEGALEAQRSADAAEQAAQRSWEAVDEVNRRGQDILRTASAELWALPEGAMDPKEFAIKAVSLFPTQEPFDHAVRDARVQRIREILHFMQPGEPTLINRGTSWLGGTFVEGPVRVYDEGRGSLGFSFAPNHRAAQKAYELGLESGEIIHKIHPAALAYRSGLQGPRQRNQSDIVMGLSNFGIGRDAIATLVTAELGSRQYTHERDLDDVQVEQDAALLAALGEAGMTLMDCNFAPHQIEEFTDMIFERATHVSTLANARNFEFVSALAALEANALQRLADHVAAELRGAIAEARSFPEYTEPIRRYARNLVVVQKLMRIGGKPLEELADQAIKAAEAEVDALEAQA